MTEQEPFNFFDRGNVTTGSRYPDTQYLPPYADEMSLQTVEHTPVPNWDEPIHTEPMFTPTPEPMRGEPQTPSWSYGQNSLFATMPSDIKARMEYQATPFYDDLSNQSAGDRLVQRVQEEATETPTNYSIYHQLRTERSLGSASLMTQALRATETTHAPEPQPQTQPAEYTSAADLPISNEAYREPVPLWGAPLRARDHNVGLESMYMRGPLPDTLTPRLETQPVVTAQETLTPAAEEISVAGQTKQATPHLPSAATTLLNRLAEQATSANITPDNEATQVISTADLAKTVATEQAISAGDKLAARVTAEATDARIEQQSPNSFRSYGKALLKAAGFRFRLARDESSDTLVGQIVDEEGTVQIDKINMDQNAKETRVLTTHKLIRRMRALKKHIPSLSEVRLA